MRTRFLLSATAVAVLLFSATEAAVVPPQPPPASASDGEESTSLPQPPKILQEQELSGKEVVGDAFPVSPESVERMLAEGAAHLAGHVADKALDRGGAPLVAQRWRGLHAAALVETGQYAKGLEILLELPRQGVEKDGRLLLALAEAYRGTGVCAKARPLFTRFLVDHPTHPGRFRAQRDNALCALSTGSLEEAELQLQLYEQESGRPQPDPLLTLGLADLAERRGSSDEALELLHRDEARELSLGERLPVVRRLAQRLIKEARPDPAQALWQEVRDHPAATPEQKVEARQALMELAAARQAWKEALLEAEALLREGVGRKVLELHATWFLDWVGEEETAPPEPAEEGPPSPPDMPPKRVDGKVVKVEEAPLAQPPPVKVPRSEKEEALLQRRGLLKQVRDTTLEASKRWVALGQLLEMEKVERLGLLTPGGLLTPEVLELDQPMPLPLRLMYANATIRFGMGEQAQKLVSGVEGMEADAVRLMLLAQGNAAAGVTVTSLLERYAPARGGLPPVLLGAAVEALYAFSERGVEVVAGQLRQVLEGYRKDPAVARALRYEEAVRLRRTGERERALWIVLELAYGGGGKEADRLLPGIPKELAAKMVSSLGLVNEARELTATKKP